MLHYTSPIPGVAHWISLWGRPQCWHSKGACSAPYEKEKRKKNRLKCTHSSVLFTQCECVTILTSCHSTLYLFLLTVFKCHNFSTYCFPQLYKQSDFFLTFGLIFESNPPCRSTLISAISLKCRTHKLLVTWRHDKRTKYIYLAMVFVFHGDFIVQTCWKGIHDAGL